MSCLFNSLSHFVSEDSFNIRQRICDYLTTNPVLFDEISASLVIEWETGSNLRDYVTRMRSPSTWGGATEIRCFVNMYKINVEVVNIRDSSGKSIVFTSASSPQTVRISWSGGHYEPIR
jgi:hypothetical protein